MTQSNPLQPTTVALVGHCGFDSGSLRRMATTAFPDAKVTMVSDDDTLQKLRNPQTLLLVNRVLDGRFSAATGVELIAAQCAGDAAPQAMLVSNYADAQQSALDAGALPGFGKNDVSDPGILDRLRTAFAQTQTA